VIKAGDLRERVRLELLVDPDDGRGGQAESWALVTDLWASVLPTGGRETLEGGALTGVQGWRVRIRWRAGVSVRHRFVWRGRQLNIRSVEDPDGRRQELLAFCESGVAQ
jgi:SPP1 family predicted phage head-tail adaptor